MGAVSAPGRSRGTSFVLWCIQLSSGMPRVTVDTRPLRTFATQSTYLRSPSFSISAR